MTLVHDLIKIRLVQQGYLPDYPYHLISDAEMCDAFLHVERSVEDGSTNLVGYFADNYPCLDSSLEDSYNALVNSILSELDNLKSSKDDIYILPDWVYSYMLGVPISIHSEIADIHDLLVPLNVDNTDDIFTPEASIACLEISKQWVTKLKDIDRPPTMFGEPHVIKSLRLRDLDTLGG